MAFSDVDRVRRLIGETIPALGGESDTLFTNSQVQSFLDTNSGRVTGAVLEGWRSKAAEYANLVNVSEGNSLREMSALYKAAQQQLQYWEKALARELAGVGTADGRGGRVVIGEISRRKRWQ